MRVIVAGRLSRKVTDRDQTGFDSQERDSVRWAVDHGHTVVDVLADFKTGRSGLAARPNLRPWVSEPEKLAQYDGIVALKVDRLTRGDRAETAKLEQWAREHGKALLIAGSDVHFPSEGTEGIQWDLMLRIAHQEWLNTSERYTRMQRSRRADDSLVGRAPYGYRIVPGINADGKPIKTLAPTDAEAEVIRDAARWYLDGNSLDTVCARLNAAGRLPRQPRPEDDAPFGRLRDGTPRPGPVLWVSKTISGVLRNETLVGRHNNHGRTLKVPPILDRATWQAVIARMDARAHRKGVSWSRNTALLTSIIRCGDCDRKMYRNGSATKFYWCHGCNAHLPVADADAWVARQVSRDTRRDIVETVIPGDDHADAIADVKHDMAEAVQAEDFDRLAPLRAELDRLRGIPSTPPRTVRRPADKTVAELWAALGDDTDARRRFLLDRRALAVYQDGWLVVALRHLDDE